MAENFVLVVYHNNKELRFDAELRVLGYTHKIAVMVYTTEIIFEPDEEKNYRAVVYDSTVKNLPDAGLLQSIASELESAFK